MITAVQTSERRPTARRPPRGSADGTGRIFVVVPLLVVLALACGLRARQSEAQSRLTLGAARSENRVLKVRQEALRAELFEVARRLAVRMPGAPSDPSRERRLPGPDRGRGST